MKAFAISIKDGSPKKAELFIKEEVKFHVQFPWINGCRLVICNTTIYIMKQDVADNFKAWLKEP